LDLRSLAEHAQNGRLARPGRPGQDAETRFGNFTKGCDLLFPRPFVFGIFRWSDTLFLQGRIEQSRPVAGDLVSRTTDATVHLFANEFANRVVAPKL
jgi:hypothetical protein